MNALYYVAPIWMGVPEAVGTIVGLATLLAWTLLELRWHLAPLGLRLPVYRRPAAGDDHGEMETATDGEGRDRKT